MRSPRHLPGHIRTEGAALGPCSPRLPQTLPGGQLGDWGGFWGTSAWIIPRDGCARWAPGHPRAGPPFPVLPGCCHSPSPWSPLSEPLLTPPAPLCVPHPAPLTVLPPHTAFSILWRKYSPGWSLSHCVFTLHGLVLCQEAGQEFGLARGGLCFRGNAQSWNDGGAGAVGFYLVPLSRREGLLSPSPVGKLRQGLPGYPLG